MPAPDSEELGIRPARDTPEDRRYVWEVNNDPSVRERAINTESIPWEEHVEWYADVMSDPDRLLFVTQYEGQDCGVVRYDLDDEAAEAEITIALQEEFRGKHIGRSVIELTSSSILERRDVDTVVAHVRPDNEPSLTAFQSAGYVERGNETLRGVEMVRLEFEGG